MTTLVRLRVTPAVVAVTAAAGALLGTGIVSIPCWFHAMTGADCPFCGGSRALGSLLHGDWRARCASTPSPSSSCCRPPWALLLGRTELGLRIPSWAVRRNALVALGIATVAWWLVRDVAFPGLQV
ncbi:DUF2752 domain-containing protein [Kutzneria sp. 744]|uniref:DUF2752 domain-containing protein n=1 Tax=Kutzneria sp. (strain 744) TaxID=345341 RepID=UPI0003EEC7F5|nr:DUF2752 domain-containing protein [Kutzneria sp. 744]EWM12951.1 hypothetical protein KUTG_03255 [Kutzneria sp. 744]